MKQQLFKNKQNVNSLLLILMLLSSYMISAQVVWHANPDTSTNVTSFFNRFDTAQSKFDGDCNTAGTSTPSITTVLEGDYGRVWRITKPKGRQRAELARTNGSLSSGNFSHGNNQAYYYGWRWKISVDGTIAASDKVTVWQWKTDVPGGKQNYPLNMEYANGRLYLEAWGPCVDNNDRLRALWSDCTGSISQRRTTLANVSVPENTWVDIVLRIRKDASAENTGQSSGYGNGSVEFWLNGVKQTLGNSGAQDYTATISSNGKKASHRTNDGDFSSAHNVYPKWGAYNSKACKYKITTFYDEMRVATTLADASPATHNPIAASTTNNTDITGSWYRLKNVQTNRYMDGNGENVATSTSNSGNDKQFRFIRQGNYYNIDIRNTSGTGTGIMRTVASENRLKLTNLSPRNNSDKVYDVVRLSDGKYSIKSTNAGKFLQNNTSNTVTLTVNGPANNNRSKWELVRVGVAKTANNKELADLTEVNDNELKSVSIYPNPVNSTFNIDLIGMEKANVTISSILGQTVFSTNTSNKNITLSKSNGFSSGIYILKVTDDKGAAFIKKFVIN